VSGEIFYNFFDFVVMGVLKMKIFNQNKASLNLSKKCLLVSSVSLDFLLFFAGSFSSKTLLKYTQTNKFHRKHVLDRTKKL